MNFKNFAIHPLPHGTNGWVKKLVSATSMQESIEQLQRCWTPTSNLDVSQCHSIASTNAVETFNKCYLTPTFLHNGS